MADTKIHFRLQFRSYFNNYKIISKGHKNNAETQNLAEALLTKEIKATLKEQDYLVKLNFSINEIFKNFLAGISVN